MNKTAKRARVRIQGVVQGVYYRASARDEAARLGLTGWVRNTDDGGVLLEAQGPADRVDALVTWCWKGPPAARVDDVVVTWLEPEAEGAGGAPGFVVRR
jgi:acylphosphatase